MTLIEALRCVPDHRHPCGRRHPLWIVLIFIVMVNLGGYWGNRPLEGYACRYGPEIAQLLHIDLQAVPSYTTFQRVHQQLDFHGFATVFGHWMSQYHTVDDDSYAIDGKQIAQALVGDDGKQRFVGLVSVFSH